MPPLLCGHRQRSCDSPPTGTFAGDITAVLAWPHPLIFCGRCHRRRGRIFRTRLSCRPRPPRLGGALQRRMRFGTLHAGRIGRHRRPDALSAAAFDIPRQAIGTPLMRFGSLQRFPAGAALCGVANSHTIPLRRCPPAQWLVPAVFRSRPNPRTVPLFAWPVSSSPAGVAGNGFRFGRRSHGSFAGFCLQPDVPGPRIWRSAPPGRSPLRERGSAHGILSFAVLLRRDSWRKAPRQPTCRLFDFAAPGRFSSQGPAGVFGSFCVPTSRGLSIAAPGFSVWPAVPSRHVGIGRYCLGLFLFQGCRARFAWHRRIACRRGSRHLASATGSRPYAGLDARLAARPIRS